ncbi:DUF2572 family protein [Papillibacter cinnamivorans]|uniref:Uncharacterized protein n=1 Tax=Papillibacter cinnamivorans DSM 12816 TaxID=1122930 RepID=A0A1W1Z357_9FIRM|nr:DUF2572 family protein [Papillibacter cinnamivorans]SMC42814.1 Protein of unknown function [Papillibacter cinnamivorans DSM 12816]
MRKYLNKKGSALVLVMSSLIILMAVGSVVVMLSAANISMSRKYSDWSEEYYWLDYAAQSQLSDLDKNVLISADTVARYYLQNSYFKYSSVSEFPSTVGMPATMQATFLGADALQGLINNEYNAIYDAYASIPVPNEDEEKTYNENMKAFINDLFEVVYYTYLNGNLSSLPSYSDTEHDIHAATSLQNSGWFPNPGSTAYASFGDFYDDISGTPKLAIKALENSGDNRKQVDVMITVVPPNFSAVQETRYYAVKANPLYANALSVRGSITFMGNSTILGDVVSCNQDSSGNSLGLGEGNSVGIKTTNNVSKTVNIYGNVYSAGDLHIWTSGSSLNVLPYSSKDPLFAAKLKLKTDYLYSSGNSYFFDFSAPGSDAQLYTEEYTATHGNPYIPYIYRDSAGGNVYCNNLAIEETVEGSAATPILGAALSVSGDLWTQDDIQNDGRSSSISVGGNYIGMRSDANEENKDPNGSSAVINNGYMYGSTIAIGGSYVIPGTAWYEFTGDYYQTAESATARAGEYFGIYEKQPVDIGDSSKIFGDYQDGTDQYSMYEHQSGHTLSSDILADRVSRFRAAMAALAGLGSGISVNGSAASYTLGIVNDDGTVVYDQYSNNLIPYKAVSGDGGILDDVFTSKTEDFGTNGFAFSDLIDASTGMDDSVHGFYYYSGNATVDVTSITAGIIYCGGNLNLTGNGTFTGTVICAGNLTVRNNTKVTYDESVIRAVLGFTDSYTLEKSESGSYLGSSVARRFFSPGSFVANTTLGIEQTTMISTSAGERDSDSIQRYIVNSWKESKAS